MLYDKVYPRKAKNIKFALKDNNKYGHINLCCWKDDIKKIKYTNKKILRDKKIYIYFPLYDDFYVKEYRSETGFTFRQLINRIHRAGKSAFTYYQNKYPETFFGKVEPLKLMRDLSLTSTNKESDIQIRKNKVYVYLDYP